MWGLDLLSDNLPAHNISLHNVMTDPTVVWIVDKFIVVLSNSMIFSRKCDFLFKVLLNSTKNKYKLWKLKLLSTYKYLGIVEQNFHNSCFTKLK